MPDWVGANWAHGIVRYRGLVVATWLVVGALLLPASRRVAQSLDLTARVPGSESAAVDSMLRARFASPYSSWAALVITGGPSLTDSAGRALLRTIVDSLQCVPGVTRTLSWLNRPDTMLVGRGGMLLVVGLDAARSADALVVALHAARDTLQRALRATYPDLTMRWTGFMPINYDLRRIGSADVAAGEMRALPVTLALL